MPPTLPVEMRDGDGVPVVCIHGWLGSKDSWRPVVDRLDADAPFVRYDQRCHGDAPCTAFDMGTLVDDLDAVIAAHTDRPPVVAAHSLGGMVALQHAVDTDTATAGLFLVGTCATTPTPVVKSPQWFLDRFDTVEREAWADLVVENYCSRGTPPGIAHAARAQLIAADETPVRCGLESMLAYDVRDRLDTVDGPVRVVGGRTDGAVTPETVHDLADGLGVTPTFLDAAHDLLHEVPAAVAAELDAFLREL